MTQAMSDDTPKHAPNEEHDEDSRDLDQRIRERAHQLWVAEGSPAGREDQYWNRAQELMQDETQSAYPPSASRGNRT
jgi:hypothetical protein